MEESVHQLEVTTFDKVMPVEEKIITESHYTKKLVSDYKFAVRHHNKNYCNTDLYCWVEE